MSTLRFCLILAREAWHHVRRQWKGPDLLSPEAKRRAARRRSLS